MNVLRMADSITGLFPKKVKVTLIHALSGKKIGEYKFNSESLPLKFKKPTILDIEGCSWRIIEVKVERSDSYLFGKKLMLRVQESVDFRQEDKFLVPTLADPLPVWAGSYLFGDFTLPVSDDDWRQLEFLPRTRLPMIQEATNTIEPILSSPSNDQALLGYDAQYIRTGIGNLCLEIPFTEFCSTIKSVEKGNLIISEKGFAVNGFALRSDNYIYYGTIEENIIRDLALQQFESVDDEFVEVVSKYGLVLVDWCNANILMHEINTDEAETEVAI